MHRWSVLAGVAITGVVLWTLIQWAGALLVELRWIHSPQAAVAATRIHSCGEGVACAEYAASCAPGATCATVVEVPLGTRDLWIHAGTVDELSGPSNVQSFTVLAPSGCEWDLDGNGNIGTGDFITFLAEFTAARFQVQHFAGYLRAMGTDCT